MSQHTGPHGTEASHVRPALVLQPEARGVSVKVGNLYKKYGPHLAIDGLDLEVRAGEFLALLGPSGSGKTTVLMSIAGFEAPTEGTIHIGDADCTHTPAHQRNLGMVFQKHTLFPHLTVLDNVAFPLKMRGLKKPERRKLAEEALSVVKLEGYGARMPTQLSGGQQQRVALARAIVYGPSLLLMDEPLSALDKNLREQMQLELKRLHSQLGITIIFVTHDQSEALTMADRVAVLKDGKIQQIGSARTLYERPANRFTAGFIGEMNFIEATVTNIQADITLTLSSGEVWTAPVSAMVDSINIGDPVNIAIRPEHAHVSRPDDINKILIRTEDVVYAGQMLLIIGRTASDHEFRSRLPGTADTANLVVGRHLSMNCPPEGLLIYRRGG